MKFNKLYLHGFKSFVDKTSVDFPDGITAIVGPNGSGKSNIMDAVRWVFGEQNAKELRGAEMEDVVFNGSQKRKAAGFAEVGLTLSEIDESVASKYGTFSEITITRKFYRTGEREYYINNRKCRLKDIKDIFMDTGLGARSISIIEQGKVDKIINAGPDELRFFLEETAGVTKFKDKKKEAERRLGQTRDNLDRVNDIIAEIVQRMESLSAQVEVLKKSEGIQSSKRTLEKKYLASVYASKSGEQESQLTRQKVVKTEYESKLAEYAAIVKSESAANASYSALEEANKALQESRLSAAKKVTKTEGEIESIRSKILNAGKLKDQLESDIDKQTALLEKAAESKEILSDKKEMAESACEDADEKLSDIESILEDIKYQKEQIEEEYSDANKIYLESTAALTNKRNELIRRESHEEHMIAGLERLKKEQLAIARQASESASRKEALLAEYKVILTELEKTEALVSEISEGKKEIATEAERLRLTQSELKATLKGLRDSAAFLEQQIAESVGTGDAELLTKFYPKLLIDETGTLAQEKLVEIGDVLLFKDSDKDAVLETVASIKQSLRFTFDSEFDSVVDMLDTISTEELPDGIYKSHGIFRKIGSDDKALKIIALKKRLAEESEKTAVANKSLSETEIQLAEAEEQVAHKNAQLESAERRMKVAASAASQLKADADAAAADSERGEKRARTISDELRISQDDYEQYTAKTVELKKEVDAAGERQLDAENSRADFEEKLENIGNMLDERKDEHHEIKIEMAAAGERLNSVKKEIEANAREVANISETLEQLRARLHSLVHIDEAMWQSDLQKLERALTEMNIALLSSEDELKGSEHKLTALKGDIETLRVDADRCNTLIKETDEELRTIEIALASALSYTDAIAAQYAEKFGEDLTVCYREYADTDFQPKKTKDEISRLEAELESLGAINLNAVNDYNESQTRYDFLTGQRNDLEGSITDINAFIYETDEATVKMFQETYNSVREKFVEVFHILFGNGEAELRLTDPENMLTTGVEIYIQPPGKRLQHMGLLSGGEKALTAMTLLFALFLQKPTPFCFLDEVDAPLDDANVARYTGMVKALSDKTQFILITHNHNTMAVADSLYGVTMQEYGVSSILSVKLEQTSHAGR